MPRRGVKGVGSLHIEINIYMGNIYKLNGERGREGSGRILR